VQTYDAYSTNIRCIHLKRERTVGDVHKQMSIN